MWKFQNFSSAKCLKSYVKEMGSKINDTWFSPPPKSSSHLRLAVNMTYDVQSLV